MCCIVSAGKDGVGVPPDIGKPPDADPGVTALAPEGGAGPLCCITAEKGSVGPFWGLTDPSIDCGLGCIILPPGVAGPLGPGLILEFTDHGLGDLKSNNGHHQSSKTKVERF